MKNIIVVTGGAGFVATNLIEMFLKKTKLEIISIDNYSSGNKKNQIKNKRVKYISTHTKNISKKSNFIVEHFKNHSYRLNIFNYPITNSATSRYWRSNSERFFS